MSRKPLRLPSVLSQVSTTPESTHRPRQSKLQSILQEEPPQMPERPTPFGIQAKLDFNDIFRNRIRYKDRNNFYKIPHSPALVYLEEVERQRLSPKSLGVVFPRGKTQSVDVKMLSIGDGYARAVSRGMRQMPLIKEINLTANRLNDRGIFPMIKSADFKSLVELNISNNKIGLKSVKLLSSKLTDSTISILNLENTHISPQSLGVLSKALINNTKVVHLNLAGNRISQITELVKFNTGIKKLDLHWNIIREENACDFFRALAVNEGIQELDLSWNSIGGSDSCSVAHAIGYFFRKNDVMQHIDLSYNNLSKEECEIIANKANSNQEILGIHLQGNHASVSETGFIIPIEEPAKFTQKFTRIFINPSREAQNCWVCEKWISVNIMWVPSKSGPCHKGPINVLMSSNDFKPLKMNQNKEGVFSIDVATPPKDLMFYFSSSEGKMLSSEYKIKDDMNFLEFRESRLFTAGPEILLASLDL